MSRRPVHIVRALVTGCAAWTALLTAAVPALARGQAPGRIEGVVIEARTGVPLVGVVVQIDVSGEATTTVADGRFGFATVPPGAHTLLVSVVGYGLVRREVVVTAGALVTVTIPVAEGARTYAEAVTVMSSPFRDAQSGIASQSVLGSRDLLALRGVLADDPIRAVQTLPGVATGDDYRSDFAVRALGPAYLGVSLDGVDSPLLYHTIRGLDDTASLALINSDVLDSVTLVAGARPQLLGPHLGAEVAFSTREGSRDRFATRGLVSATAATAVLEGPLGPGRRGSWLVAARQSYLDWLVRAVTDETSAFGFTDLQAQLAWDLTPAQTLRVSAVGGRSLLKEENLNPTVNSLDSGASKTLLTNARWRWQARPGLVVQQQLYGVFARYDNRVRDGRRREEGRDRDVTWRGFAEWRVAPAHTLSAGGQAQALRAARLDRRFTATAAVLNFDVTADGRAGAVWAQDRVTLGPRIMITSGARADWWLATAGPSPSAWLLTEVALAKATRLRGGAARLAQGPQPDQIALAERGRRLDVQQANAFDLGLEQRLGERWRLNLAAYHRAERQRLRFGTTEPRLSGSAVIVPAATGWTNALDGRARGLEFTVERRSANGLSGWLAYAWGRHDETVRATGETYPGDYDQRHTLNSYGIYRWSGRTSVSARGRLGSNFPLAGYYDRVSGDQYTIGATRNSERLPLYSRVDVRADRTFTRRSRRLTLFVEVVNAFNRANLGSADPGINVRTRAVTGLVETLFPLLPSAGLLIEF
jgi:CarboxypepD_reg-like domain